MKPLKSLKLGAAVRVVWVDSFVVSGWRNVDEDIQDDVRIVTQGFVTKSDKGFLGISSTISQRGHTVDPIHVPWVAIEQLTRLGKRWDR